MALVPVAEDAKTKPYYKYYEQGIASPTPEQLAYIEGSKGSLENALEAKDRDAFLDPGAAPEKMGFYPLAGGSLLVSGEIEMPGVTPEMLYWWFAWHGLEPLRYSLWDPEDHYDVQINEEGRRRATDPSIPMEEKTWGATHTVQESIGDPPDEIVIMFKDPSEMGFDMTKVGPDKDCKFLVCANALLGSMKVPVIMAECLKTIGETNYYQARFWIGYHVVDGEAKCLVPVTQVIPEEECDIIAKGLLAHNIKEFTNLGKILPGIFEEEGSKPIR